MIELSKDFNVMYNYDFGDSDDTVDVDDEEDDGSAEEAAMMANMMAKIDEQTHKTQETRYYTIMKISSLSISLKLSMSLK